MKYLLLFLVSTSAFALEFWEPHEKELAALEWKAAHSPQEKLAARYAKLESMDFARDFMYSLKYASMESSPDQYRDTRTYEFPRKNFYQEESGLDRISSHNIH